MIFTFNLNAALDITFTGNHLKTGELNRTVWRSLSAGGKGFNISRALNCLGLNNKAFSFCGGRFGEILKDILISDGISTNLIPVEKEIRLNIKIIDDFSGKLTEFNEAGPQIRQAELQLLFEEIRKIIESLRPGKEKAYFAIGGSIPSTLNPSLYEEIISMVKGNYTGTLLDSSGEVLFRAMNAVPGIIKVNLKELKEVSKEYFKDSPENVIKEVLGRGVDMVMVTDGPGKVFCYTGGRVYAAIPPVIEKGNPVGSGDCVDAGLIYASINGYGILEKIRFAIACGAANLLTEVPGKIDLAEIKKLVKMTDVYEKI